MNRAYIYVAVAVLFWVMTSLALRHPHTSVYIERDGRRVPCEKVDSNTWDCR